MRHTPNLYNGPWQWIAGIACVVIVGALVGAFVVWQRQLAKPVRGRRYIFDDDRNLPAILDVERGLCRCARPMPTSAHRDAPKYCHRCKGKIE